MLIYIIDGFNLVHKIGSIKDSVSPHRDLISYIKKNRLTGSRNNKVVVVFDGHENDDVGWEREFRILFSGDRTADDIIKEKIVGAGNKSQIVVVSDDREIRDCARREGARPVGTRDFLKSRVKEIAQSEKDISCSEAMEINEELEKIWLD